MSTEPITAEEARQLFDYDPKSGDLTWKVSLNPRAPVGHVVRAPNSRGYYTVRVRGKPYGAHRVAWLIATGTWPAEHIDHINGDKTDNRVENLREATNAENQRNRAAQRNNTSGFKGVSWNKRDSKWRAYIQVDGKFRHLGNFATPEEAHAAYCKAAEELFGEIANFG